MGRVAIESVEGNQRRVSGELVFASVREALGQSDALFDDADGELQVDLGGVERADSAGIALLIEWARRAKARNLDIQYTHMPEQMAAIAEISHLDRVLRYSVA